MHCRRQKRQNSYFFERFDTLVGLNAFGRFVMNRPEHQALFGSRIRVSPDVEKMLRQDRKAEWVTRHVEGLLKKLKTDPAAFRGELGHDAVFKKVKNPTFNLYKSPGRSLVCRVAYLYDDVAEELFINRIWTDHDLYEREADQGGGFCEDPDKIQWRDVTDWLMGG